MSEPIRKPDENPSRVESILSDTIGLSGYEIEAPRSRIEILLLELEELIKEGGGGGESSNYGTSISIEMDSNFVMSASLLNKDGEVLGEVQTVDLPLESVVVNGSYDSINKQVVLTLQNGSTIRFSVADLVDGLQTEITSQNPLNADLVSDSNSTHKFTTASDISKLAGIEPQANKTTVDDALSGSSINPVQNKIVKTALDSKADTSTTYTKTEVDTALDDKVDKETGKGLSTNDYTTAEKTKLAGIAEGAEVNVQPNWTQTTTTANDYIKNKPTLGTASALDVAASGNASTSQVVKGNDTRLTDARNAADVSSWAKAENKPSYNGSEIELTGYIEAQSKSSVAATDTTNVAIGKLEYRAETNENNILTIANQSTRYNVLNLSAAENVSASSGITYSILSDGSVHIEADINVTGSALYFEKIPITSNIPYITTGCPSGGGNTTYKIQIYDNETNIANADDTGSGSEPFTITTGKIGYRIRFAEGQYNIVVKPMVISKSLYDSGFANYQPYAMSNAELTAAIQAIQAQLANQ